ncbi:MAG: hypothetical protein NZO16_04990 [Deltaproteobacteria bacterium]|nr:hypothetical protein [Deltaproteobacteria bacterium]
MYDLKLDERAQRRSPCGQIHWQESLSVELRRLVETGDQPTFQYFNWGLVVLPTLIKFTRDEIDSDCLTLYDLDQQARDCSGLINDLYNIEREEFDKFLERLPARIIPDKDRYDFQIEVWVFSVENDALDFPEIIVISYPFQDLPRRPVLVTRVTRTGFDPVKYYLNLAHSIVLASEERMMLTVKFEGLLSRKMIKSGTLGIYDFIKLPSDKKDSTREAYSFISDLAKLKSREEPAIDVGHESSWKRLLWNLLAANVTELATIISRHHELQRLAKRW